MEKKNIVCTLVLVMFMISFTSAFYSEKITITTQEPKVFSIREKDYLINPQEVGFIEDLAIENKEYREYRLHHYDCTQFSERLVYLLEKEGYKAQCTAGNNWAFDYTNHTWVSVWVNDVRLEIEATSGRILTPQDLETYEVNWEDRCW